MVICWFNRHRRTKIRPLFGEKIICLDGRGSSGRWCTTTGSSVVRVTIERRDKSEGSERSASVQSVPGKCIIDFTWDIDIAGYCSHHQTHASWFLLFYASGDLRENIALTMAFWRAWHARGEGNRATWKNDRRWIRREREDLGNLMRGQIVKHEVWWQSTTSENRTIASGMNDFAAWSPEFASVLLSLSALCPGPRLISFLFPSLFLFFVSFFRVFHFLNASFRNVRTHFFVSLIERWDSRGSHLSPIVKIEKRERERQREKHGGGDIYGIVDKSCCAALYLLFDWHRLKLPFRGFLR